jgi:diguanylate cyclase (GGDEF)-like protein
MDSEKHLPRLDIPEVKGKGDLPREELLAAEVRQKVWQRDLGAMTLAATETLLEEKQVLEEEAVRDKTGLLNDKGFLRETADRLKDGGRAVILFLDIDDFKKFNDTYGQAVGDEVLKVVAAKLKQRFRGTDVLCRWGGEEFVVCLFNTTADKVLRSFPNQEGIKLKFAEFSKRGSDISKRLPPGLGISLSGGADDLIVEQQRGVDVVEKISSVIQNASLAKNAAKRTAGKCRILKFQEGMASPEQLSQAFP